MDRARPRKAAGMTLGGALVSSAKLWWHCHRETATRQWGSWLGIIRDSPNRPYWATLRQAAQSSPALDRKVCLQRKVMWETSTNTGSRIGGFEEETTK